MVEIYVTPDGEVMFARSLRSAKRGSEREVKYISVPKKAWPSLTSADYFVTLTPIQ